MAKTTRRGANVLKTSAGSWSRGREETWGRKAKPTNARACGRTLVRGDGVGHDCMHANSLFAQC